MAPKRQGQMVSDETLLETLTDLYEAGDTLGGGGVPPQRVADELPICSKTVRKRLADLANDGEAEVDWGFRDCKGRRGYAPVTDEEEPTRRLITDGGTDARQVEWEKNKSFELGHISQLEDVAEELRERSGEIYAQADRRREIQKAKQLKELAREFEERAENRREQWEEKFKNQPPETKTDADAGGDGQ